MTAAKVARVFVFASQHPRYGSLLPEGAGAMTERVLIASGVMPSWVQRFYASARNRRWLERIGERLGPGQLARMALRKRFMDDEIRAALADGATQVLVLGAGYDTACMRLAPEFPDRLFVEIDHPATQASKRRGLAVIGPIPDNLRLLPVDLAKTTLLETLAELDQPAWDSEATTVVVAEGVLMYLDRDDVTRTFAAVHELTGPRSRFAFSYMRCDAESRPHVGRLVGGLTRWSLRLLGEPLRWCVADSRELAELLDALGWRYKPAPERFDLVTRYLGGPVSGDDDPIEFMAVVDRKP